MTVDSSVPSHQSPVVHIVAQDEIFYKDGSWREHYPIYVTTRPTGNSAGLRADARPREATKRRNLPSSHPDDFKSHHRLEIAGEKHELRNIDGRIE